MKFGRVVIGANYGDEGKGLLTDYYASEDLANTLVVRFNGGAQAGHTVVAPNGMRHVFSHFGSGTLLNCPTYLSKFFIVNPMLCLQERDQLLHESISPELIFHPASLLTTPFDMFINQQVEFMRNSNRHGSCGIGINETVTRCSFAPEFKTTVADSDDAVDLYRKLIHIQNKWFTARLTSLGIDLSNENLENFRSNLHGILEKYIDDVRVMRALYEVTDLYPQYGRIIFEGAQGLMLDEDRLDQFPHVTRSKTGLFNVLHLAPKFGIDSLKVTYATRTYLTRHGAGPLENECNWKFSDATNIPNQFQGTLRFAPLCLKTLQRNIEIDLARAKRSKLRVEAELAVTCADQNPAPDFRDFSIPQNLTSYGPTRKDIASAKPFKHPSDTFDASGRLT